MARIYQDGFDLNSTTANLNTWDTWAGSTIGTTNARTGTYGMRVSSLSSGTAQGALKKWLASAANGPFFFRAYIKIVTPPSATNTVMYFSAASTLGTNPRCSIALKSDGTLILQNPTPAQIGSASAAINDGNWHMLELKTDTNAASGSRTIEGRLDGSVFATSSAQSQSSSFSICVGGNLASEAQTTGEWWFDDIAVNDNSGSFQTSYPGSGKVLTLRPSAAGDVNGFLVQVGGTIGSANNFTRVNEVTPNDATSYNASAVLNAEDLFNVDDSGIGASDTVNTVLVGFRLADITASDATTAIKAEIIKTSGGTKSQSADVIPNTTSWNTNGPSSPRNYPLITYQDPDGSNWTQTTLDSMQVGYIIDAVAVRAIGITNIWASVDYTPSSGANASVTQVVATLTVTGGTQAIATVNNVSIAQATATLTITGGVQSATTTSLIAQTGAVITASGGVQTIATIQNVAISQTSATLTVSGEVQTVDTIDNVSIIQLAVNVTAMGGTQSVGSQIDISISQVAANLTATNGTQAVVTLQTVSITQGGMSITATGGTQVVQTNSFITQSVANLTTTGGTQSVGTINDVSLTQLSATLTISGGTQVTSTVNNSAIPQTAATVIASGGTQSLTAQVDIAIAQQVANLILTGGTQTVSASSGASSASITQVGVALVLTGNRQVITTSTGPLPPTRAKSVVFLLDGRIAVRIANNLYMPL